MARRYQIYFTVFMCLLPMRLCTSMAPTLSKDIQTSIKQTTTSPDLMTNSQGAQITKSNEPEDTQIMENQTTSALGGTTKSHTMGATETSKQHLNTEILENQGTSSYLAMTTESQTMGVSMAGKESDEITKISEIEITSTLEIMTNEPKDEVLMTTKYETIDHSDNNTSSIPEVTSHVSVSTQQADEASTTHSIEDGGPANLTSTSTEDSLPMMTSTEQSIHDSNDVTTIHQSEESTGDMNTVTDLVHMAESTTVDPFAEWRGKEQECFMYLLSQPQYQYLFESEEYLCICFYKKCPTTTVKETTTLDPLAEWRGREGDCVQYLLSQPQYQHLFPTQEYLCVCFYKNCPDTEATVTEGTDNMVPGQTTEVWFGKGDECIERVFYVYHLDLRQEEYMCLCYDACTEEEIDTYVEEVKGKDKDKTGETAEKAIKGILYGLIILTGVFGNVLVIVTIAGFMGKKTVTNIYICNLAVADLLVILICVPFKIVETMAGKWEGSEAGCKTVAWLYLALFMASVLTLTCMSMERFLVICYPIYAHIVNSMQRTVIVIVACWVMAAGLAAPALYVMQVDPLTEACLADRTQDGFSKRAGFYIYIFLVLFVLPVGVMTFAYVRTMVTLWASIKKMREMKNTHTGKKDDKTNTPNSGRAQVIRVLIIVLVVFVVCWAPYLLLQVISNSRRNLFTLSQYNTSKAASWLNLLTLANSCLNPILYGVLSRKYREGFMRCLRCDRASVNKKKGSVLTALSSASGSVQKTKRSISNGSLSTSGVSNGLAMGSINVDKVNQDRKNSCNSTNGIGNKAFDREESSCTLDEESTVEMKDGNSDEALKMDTATVHNGITTLQNGTMTQPSDTKIYHNGSITQINDIKALENGTTLNPKNVITDTASTMDNMESTAKSTNEMATVGSNPYESEI